MVWTSVRESPLVVLMSTELERKVFLLESDVMGAAR